MTNNKLLFYTIFVSIFAGITVLYFCYGSPSAIVIQNIRIPRFILTLLTGMVLATIGNTYQMLLNNPLAEPYILGTSSGSALFAITAYILGYYLLMPVFGFLGAFSSILAVWMLTKQGKSFNSVKLILSGIIISMICGAVISLYIYLFPDKVSAIMSVLMGSLNHVFTNTEWLYFLALAVLSLVLMVYLYFLTNSLNIISTGEVTAHTLGINTSKIRKKIFIITSILVAIVTSYAGIIGFVGLIIPHILRLILGDNIKNNYFLTMISGGLFLLLCDFIAFHISPIGELPVGIITTIIGSVFFMKLLKRGER